MKRDLVFVQDEGTLVEVLAITPERAQEIDIFVNALADKGATLGDVVRALNERGDLTDSEWSTAMYALGYVQGQQSRSRRQM